MWLPAPLASPQPTSGLDSTTALKLLHTLRSLASGGRTIITSIHQPSSRLYQQMDKVCKVAFLVSRDTTSIGQRFWPLVRCWTCTRAACNCHLDSFR